MRSEVGWLLVGLVLQKSSYGYEIYRRFVRLYDGLRPTGNPGHIYHYLGRLVDRDLLKELPGTGPKGQPRPYYMVTVKGRKAYEDWLVGQMAEERRRSQLAVYQLAAFANSPQTVLNILDRAEHIVLAEMSGSNPHPLLPNAELIVRLSNEERRLAAEARLAWIQYARQLFTPIVKRQGT